MAKKVKLSIEGLEVVSHLIYELLLRMEVMI
jgi:hypothetical protein